jgi:[NiFe] hydrogenase diaphorase moiety large subunit
LIKELKKYGDPKKMPLPVGDGNNAHELVMSMVNNGVIKKGAVLFGTHEPESGLKKALEKDPDAVIKEIKTSRLRGRGGAGFPTGMKWEFTRAAQGNKKYVLCNADEGEPGTFKDRVLLTEKYDLLFEGMTIGGYAIGAEEGIVYLRAEYAYLNNFLNAMLAARRKKRLLGKNILKKNGFNFDIRIQSGAGAYICGEESALISSCEGLRGDPKNRPPFPAQKGYKQGPTTVNNVETFCAVARILNEGPAWFNTIGTPGSPGTKLLSVSGDCAKPGIYEVPLGTKVADLLKEVGAQDTRAVLMGGPSGQFIGSVDFNRVICYDDLATGGSIVVFNTARNLLEIVHSYMEFFVDESCGFCTPCRVGNVLLKNCIEKILAGKGEPADLGYMEKIGSVMKGTSRCGLGQTSANPVVSTLKNFRSIYEAVVKDPQGLEPAFDIKEALKDGEEAAGRESVYK